MFQSHELYVDAEVAYRRELMSPRQPRRKGRRARRQSAGRPGAVSQRHGAATA